MGIASAQLAPGWAKLARVALDQARRTMAEADGRGAPSSRSGWRQLRRRRGAEPTAKGNAIRATTRLLRCPTTDRLGGLYDVAFGFEARRLRFGDNSAQSRKRVMDAPSTRSGHGSDPTTLRPHADVLWLRGRPDAVSDLTTEVNGRRGLALCDGASIHAPGAVADVLDPLRPAARYGPFVLAGINFALAAT